MISIHTYSQCHNTSLKDNFIFNDGSVGINGTPYTDTKLAVGGKQVVNGVLGVGRAVGTSLDFNLTGSKFVIEKEKASSRWPS